VDSSNFDAQKFWVLILHWIAEVVQGFNGNPEYYRSGAARLGAERRTAMMLAGEAAQRKFVHHLSAENMRGSIAMML
jgi:hypothetical protein